MRNPALGQIFNGMDVGKGSQMLVRLSSPILCGLTVTADCAPNEELANAVPAAMAGYGDSVGMNTDLNSIDVQWR